MLFTGEVLGALPPIFFSLLHYHSIALGREVVPVEGIFAEESVVDEGHLAILDSVEIDVKQVLLNAVFLRGASGLFGLHDLGQKDFWRVICDLGCSCASHKARTDDSRFKHF